MLKNVSHAGGVEAVGEILFTTPFGYMFRDAAESSEGLLPASERTTDALLMLGDAMGDASTPPDPALDSSIPAVMTYLGQFIDHDVTARTDRETGLSQISQADGRPVPIQPVAPAAVTAGLRNGRRPQLDLDSLYGDGPRLIPPPVLGTDTEASALYEDPVNGKLKLQDLGNDQVDLPRNDDRTALIADGRNDENINVSQLHAAFIALHNKVIDELQSPANPAGKYARARQIVRWVYQYIVAREYLPQVCHPAVVNDIMRNGPYVFGPGTGGMELFMPLEFSVAGFRFGHSMVRPSYKIGSGAPVTISSILGTSVVRPPADDLLEDVGGWRLKAQNRIEWSNYIEFPGMAAPQKARRIDPLVSRGLFDLPFESESGPAAMIRHLAQRNLCRGYLLSIPTGQAVAGAMGIVPLKEGELHDGEPDIVAALEHGRFQQRTPLWYYVLREAKVQNNGAMLGVVGSRIVAETLIGFLKHDPNSYLNNQTNDRIQPTGIKVPGRTDPIGSLADMIDYIGLKK